MASILRVPCGKWRIHLCIGRKRESKTFLAKTEASQWAEVRARTLRTLQKLGAVETVSRSDWANLKATHRKISKQQILAASKSFEDVCGVYFLIYEGEILCIGQSKNCYKRIDAHKKSKVFDRYTIIKCDQSALDHMEKLFIQQYTPPLNKAVLTEDIEPTLS